MPDSEGGIMSGVWYNRAMPRLLMTLLAILAVLLTACDTTPSPEPENVEATVQAALTASAVPVSTPDIEATISAEVQAVLSATPNVTPDIQATVAAGVQATVEAIKTATFVAAYTVTPSATAPPTSTPLPTQTPVPTSTPTATPVPTATATPVPSPTATAIVVSTPTLSQTISRIETAVVRVVAGNSSGSGFIYDEDGWVLTNAHVVGSRRDVKVIMGESVEFDGRVVGIDEGVDLAVIKVESDEPLPVLLFGDSSEVSVGDDVVALGFPLGSILGDAISVTKGVLSSRRNNDNILYLQTDAAINPGNSGGPLVNSSGEVIGLNTSRIERVLERSVQGIGLAIASNDINELLPALMDGAQVRNTSEQATEEGSDSDGRVYESDKYWYTIDVPPEWRMDSGNPENVSIWEPQTVSSIVIVAQEADVEEYPTIESYARGGWEPAPSEGWSNWRIVNSGPIRTDSTIQAYEFIYTFRLNGDRWTGKSQWYLLGGHRVRVDALAEQFVWNGTSGLIEQLLEVQESFEPAQYTSEEHGYSISHLLDW
jgi:S1-C subfamily serine protease